MSERTIKLPRGGKAVIPFIGLAVDEPKDSTRPHKPCRQGLGDTTEKLLAGIGVTKERYMAAKKLFGLSPTCSCNARKEWLNKVSDWWRREGKK